MTQQTNTNNVGGNINHNQSIGRGREKGWSDFDGSGDHRNNT